jgi:glycosyltransferase involved in cell wall biosynthesis
MGYGIVPIVSDIPENVLPVGKNGLIFKNKDVKNLEEKLIFAIRSSSLMKKMGKAAKANIEANYNWDENAQRTVRIYEEIILRKKGYFGRLLTDKLL